MNEAAYTVLSGTAHPQLAAAVARELGCTVSACTVQRFPDGEVGVSLHASVRRQDVLVVQPTSPPVNDHVIEALALADACRRDGAARIMAIVPYFGYARGDKRHGRREPIMARMMAELMQTVGFDYVLTIDVHSPQLEGFFHIPMDSVSAVPTLCNALKQWVTTETVVVAPDAGRVGMATVYAEHLGLPLVVCHKQRDSGSQTRVLRIVGEVRGRPCLIVDDMISTGGTIMTTIDALRAAGAMGDVTVAASHGLLLGDAAEKLAERGVRRLVVTDSVPVHVPTGDRPVVEIVPVAPLLAAALRLVLGGRPLHELDRDVLMTGTAGGAR
ncbi:MAG: ribose-phosphate pyrophosphokinase [Herpetosiphon sp.]